MTSSGTDSASGAETPQEPLASDTATREREHARRRVQAKRKFHADVVAYVVINAFLVGVWAVSDGEDFWPGWVLAGWGVLLVLQGYDAYFRRPITEADVDAEIERQRQA